MLSIQKELSDAREELETWTQEGFKLLKAAKLKQMEDSDKERKDDDGGSEDGVQGMQPDQITKLLESLSKLSQTIADDAQADDQAISQIRGNSEIWALCENVTHYTFMDHTTALNAFRDFKTILWWAMRLGGPAYDYEIVTAGAACLYTIYILDSIRKVQRYASLSLRWTCILFQRIDQISLLLENCSTLSIWKGITCWTWFGKCYKAHVVEKLLWFLGD